MTLIPTQIRIRIDCLGTNTADQSYKENRSLQVIVFIKMILQRSWQQ